MVNQLWNLKFKFERKKMKSLTDFLQSWLPNSTFKESSFLESGFLWRNLFSTDQKKYFPAMWIFHWTYRFQSRAVFPSWRLSFPKLFEMKQRTISTKVLWQGGDMTSYDTWIILRELWQIFKFNRCKMKRYQYFYGDVTNIQVHLVQNIRT